MKKITFLLIALLYAALGHAQLEENFDVTTSSPDASGNWVLPSGTWLVRDNMTNSAPNWEFSPDIYPGNGGLPSKAAFIQRQNNGAGVLSQEWLITPQQVLTPNKQLRFFTAQTVAGDVGTLYQIRLSSNPDPANLGAYAILAQYTETQLSTLTPSQLDYEEKIINLNLSGNWHIAFVKVFNQPDASNSGDRWLVDNVTIVDRCVEPTLLNATNISVYNATLIWEGTADAYTIEYGPAGFTPNTGAGTIINNFTGNSYEIPLGTPTGPLAPSTAYQFYVTAVCEDSSSELTGPFSFTTLAIGSVCATPLVIGTLPYYHTSSTTFYGNNINVPFIEDTNCGATNFYFGGDDVVYSYTAPANTLGVIDITLNPLGDNHSAIFVYNSCADIGETCLASAGGDWGNSIRNIPDFPISAGQTIYIVISSSEFNGTIDYNLTIQEVPCTSPTNLTALASGTDTVNLSWEQTGGPTSWEVFIQNVGEPIPTVAGTATSNSVNYTATTLTASGNTLVASTSYQYWVRADCGNGTFGAWVGPYIFYTTCPDFCYYKFVLRDTDGDGWDPNKLKIMQNGTVVDIIGGSFTDGSGPVTIDVALCNGPFEVYLVNFDLTYIAMEFDIINSFNQNIFTWTYVWVPGFNAFTDPFYTGVANCDTPLQICLPPVELAVTDITTEGATLSWTPQGPAPLSWDVFIIPAGSPAPTAATVPTFNTTDNPVIVNTLIFDTEYVYYVRAVCSFPGENVWSVPSAPFTTLQLCNKPTNVTLVNATLDSLEIDWTNGGTESEWQYIIVPAGAPLPAVSDPGWTTTTSHPVVIPNLATTTAYDIYVRSVCSPTLLSNPTGPLTANTVLCLPEDQCLFTFTMSDFDGYGWVLTNNTMTISQNGIAVAVLGSTFTSGNSATIQVPLCNSIPFELEWTTSNYYQGTGITITNPQGVVIYDKPFGSGLPGDLLYSGTAICGAAPSCVPPSDIFISSTTIDSATISWTENNLPPAISWDILVLPASQPAPLQQATGWTNVNTNTNYVYTGLNAGIAYKAYVRSICSDTDKSYWSDAGQFNTAVCDPSDVCDYTFVMGDSVDGGWSNNTIQIIQNGIVIYTLAGPAVGQGSQSVTVSLCNNVPFDLFWNNVGLWVNTMSLSVLDTSGTEVYGFDFEEAVDLNLYGTLFYTGTTTCTPATCPKPVQLYASNPTASTITLGWTEAGTATQYEILILPVNAPDPLPSDVGIPATNPYTATLVSGVQYKFYVRAICSDSSISTWSLPENFSLLLANDNCSGAISLPVNAGVECIQSVSATLVGATQSPQFTDCNGAADDDIWFEFTATAATHVISVSNLTGSNDFYPIAVVVYQGNQCNGLTTVNCNDLISGEFDPASGLGSVILLRELIPGQNYLVRAYSKTATPNQTINFDICVTTLPLAITTSTTQYTPEQLVADVLSNSDCATVSNVTYSTGTDFGSNNGIGYFEKNNSSFPFEDGIVLMNSAVGTALGPNLDYQGPSFADESTWDGDSDLDALLTAQGFPGNTRNATVLEFDFVPLTNSISFNFLFASDEYGIYQCFFSDVFAFLLTDTATSVTTNLAVVPNTTIPVSVGTIRDAQFNSSCASENPQYFGDFYQLPQGTNPSLAPINFTGVTVPLTASAPVVPGQLYHIKLAIADYNDWVLNSAVFLEGGSLDLGNVNVGDDLTAANGTAICSGQSTVLDSQLTTEFYDFTWELNGQVIANATGSTYTATQPGTYTVTATYTNSICISTDSIVVEFFSPVVPGAAQNLTICTTATNAVFDLTQNAPAILAPLSPDHTIAYFTSQADAESNQNAIANPATYSNIANPQTIYVRVENSTSGCFAIVTFTLSLENLIPQFTLPSDVFVCNGQPQNIGVTAVNFNLTDATFSWTLNGTPLAATTSSINATQSGVYEVTVTRNSCSSTASSTVTVGSEIVPVFASLPTTICQNATAQVLPSVSDNNLQGTWSPAAIDTGNSGTSTYTFTSDASNCNTSYSFTVTIEEVPQFGIQGSCEGNRYVLTATPINNYDATTATYLWTDSLGNPVPNGNTDSVIVTSAGIYSLEITAQGCSSSESFTAGAMACSIQKGISPNNDNRNDYFDLEGMNVRQLSIFNRYGMEVYSFKNYSNQWYGQSDDGKELPDGTYYYAINREGMETVTGWIYINREQ